MSPFRQNATVNHAVALPREASGSRSAAEVGELGRQTRETRRVGAGVRVRAWAFCPDGGESGKRGGFARDHPSAAAEKPGWLFRAGLWPG
jgi:hypothetical protein